MKKISVVLLLSMFSVFLGVGFVSAGPSVDQQFTGGGASLAISSKQRMAQRFLPSMTGLSKIEIELANVVGTKKVSVTIRHKTDLIWDEADVASVNNQTATNGWNIFDFEDVTVIKDGWYGIFVTADAGPQWKYSAGPSTYDRGYAIFDSNDYADADFNFKTWGTDPVDIVEEQTNPGSDKTDDETGEVAATSGNVAPSATTSSSIVKPTELKAEFTEAVKLSWKASTTTDIDGYYIFRSETKGKNYSKVGTVEKSILEYTDTTAEASKTYYYIVRAYKSTTQSESSNEASVVVPENAGPISPLNLKIDYFSDSQIRVTWDKNPETNISEYLVSIYQGDKLISTKTVKAENNSCLFQDLTANTNYKISVIAKNSLEKSSQPSEITQKTASTPIEEQIEIMSAFEWALFSVASLLTLVLIVLFYRRHKKSKEMGRI